MEHQQHERSGHVQALRELIDDLHDQPCLAWRKSYGRTGTLHFGEWMQKEVVRPKTVYHEQGSWVVGLSDCDRRLRTPEGEQLEDFGSDESLLGRLDVLKGSTVTRVELDDDLSLRLTFADSSRLALVVDAKSADEQWSVRTPTGQWAVVYRDGRCVLEE